MPEVETWRYRGQTIDREQIAFLREFIGEHPDSSRWKLSRQLCEALDWKQSQRRIARRGVPRSAADAGPGWRDRVAGGAPSDPRPAPDGAAAAGRSSDRHY